LAAGALGLHGRFDSFNRCTNISGIEGPIGFKLFNFGLSLLPDASAKYALNEGHNNVASNLSRYGMPYAMHSRISQRAECSPEF
jgi:hypothetical protein